MNRSTERETSFSKIIARLLRIRYQLLFATGETTAAVQARYSSNIGGRMCMAAMAASLFFRRVESLVCVEDMESQQEIADVKLWMTV